MAWWNTPSQMAAPPLVIERLEAGLDRLGLTTRGRPLGLPDTLDLTLQEYPLRLALGSGYLVATSTYPHLLPVRAAPALREAALAANATSALPDLRVTTDDAGAHLTATVRVQVSAGLSDAQLADVLREGLGSLVRGLDMLGERLGLPGPAVESPSPADPSPTAPDEPSPPAAG